ncbi:hypothetical protein SERLADRAFT_398193, partial [Serpula lacrymans var. lacrymans S7.9]
MAVSSSMLIGLEGEPVSGLCIAPGGLSFCPFDIRDCCFDGVLAAGIWSITSCRPRRAPRRFVRRRVWAFGTGRGGY